MTFTATTATAVVEVGPTLRTILAAHRITHAYKKTFQTFIEIK